MSLHTSSNGWLAWVEIDPVANNNALTSKSEGKRFVIVGFLPSNQFCIAPDSYGSVEEAQEVISSLDNQTVAFECGDQLVKVFTCFDSSYWWHAFSPNQIKYSPQRIYTAQSTTEAVALVASLLSCNAASKNQTRKRRAERLPQYLSL